MDCALFSGSCCDYPVALLCWRSRLAFHVAVQPSGGAANCTCSEPSNGYRYRDTSLHNEWLFEQIERTPLKQWCNGATRILLPPRPKKKRLGRGQHAPTHTAGFNLVSKGLSEYKGHRCCSIDAHGRELEVVRMSLQSNFQFKSKKFQSNCRRSTAVQRH